MQSNYSDREIKRILNNNIEMPYCVNARLERCNATVTNVSISPISIPVRYDYQRNEIEVPVK